MTHHDGSAFALLDPPINAQKRCPGCARTKPGAEFYQHRDGRLSSYCRSCQRMSSHASYQRRCQDPAELALMRARDRRRKQEIRAFRRDGED